MQSPLYYRHSGKVGRLALPYMLGLGVVGSFVLGPVYAYADYYIPFIYLNFFLTLFYGMGIGFLVVFGAQRGQVRNSLVALLGGFLAGLIALYVAWAFWIQAVTGGRLMTFSPSTLLQAIQTINGRGVWRISKSQPVTGTLLYIVWFAEALIIVGTSALIAYFSNSDEPFCERCKSWIKEKRVISPLQVIANPAAFRAGVERGDYGELLALRPASSGDAASTRLELLHCPGCRQSFFLTIKETMMTVDSKGNYSKQETTLVQYLSIQSALHETLNQQWTTYGPTYETGASYPSSKGAGQ